LAATRRIAVALVNAGNGPTAPSAAGTDNEEKQIIVWKLAGETYCANVLHTREIVNVRKKVITRIPRAPEFVVGVWNLRGRILPVIDARKVLGLDPAPAVEDTDENPHMVTIVVAIMRDAQGQDRDVGMIVDDVTHVTKTRSDIEPLSPVVGRGVDYAKGTIRLNDEPILYVDLKHLLDKNQRSAMDAAGIA
jgi:purine-binding chemotaxis protein CheW